MIQVSCVLCHHRGELINNALESLHQIVRIDYEIIVVTSCDNQEFPLADRVIFEEGGPAHKRNVGAKFARGRYLAFLDDDIEATPTCLAEMVKVLSQPGVGMVYGKTRNMEFRNRFDGAGSFLTSTGFLWAREENGVEDVGQYDVEEEIFAGKGAFMMLKRSTFDKVGGFEPIYEILAEETDISWAVWFIGEKVMWVPKALLYHAFNTRFKPWNYYYTNKRVYFNGCRNYILMHLKFLEWKNVIRIVPILSIVWFVAGLGMLVTGKVDAGWNIFKGLAYHLFNFKDTLARRAKVQALRTMSDSELFEHIMKKPSVSFYLNRLLNYIKTGRHG